MAMMLPRLWMYSHRARSMTRALFTEGMARKSKVAEPQPSLRWRVLLVLRSGLSAPLPSVPQARLRRWFSSRQGTRCS